MIISGELVNLNKLKEVEIKEGVTEIPYQFLKGCNSLEKNYITVNDRNYR